MPHMAPFTAYLRVVASRGKRFETVRSLQRLAALIYGGGNGASGLLGNSNIQVATPGGGQASQLTNAFAGSDYIPGCAYTPQFGEQPALLMITGFYILSTPSIQPWPAQPVFSPQDATTPAKEAVTRYGGSWAQGAVPDPTVAAEVHALKAIFDGVITATVPNESVSTWRIDYKNIIWGDRGFTFP